MSQKAEGTWVWQCGQVGESLEMGREQMVCSLVKNNEQVWIFSGRIQARECLQSDFRFQKDFSNLAVENGLEGLRVKIRTSVKMVGVSWDKMLSLVFKGREGF